MKIYFLFFICLFACPVFWAQEIQSQPLAPVFGNTSDVEYGEKFYRLYTGFCSYEEATKTAAKVGGVLVTPSSKEENNFITNWLSPFIGNFFLGITRNHSDQWITSDGQVLNYQNWIDEIAASKKENKQVLINFSDKNGKWSPVETGAKASGFIVQFNRKPKPPPIINGNKYDIPVYEEELSELSSLEKGSTAPAPSELPTALSANSLYNNYMYHGGTFNQKLQEKNTTISGLTTPSAIREIQDGDKLWSKYQGKFLMPLLDESIICFLDERPDIGNAPWSIVKIKGSIKRGPQFKQLVIENARFIGSRKVQAVRRLAASKNDNLVKITGILNNLETIINDNTVEIKNPENDDFRSCTIGDDPEGYALEIYSLKRNGATSLVVGVIGSLSDPEDKEGPLSRCRISGWFMPGNRGDNLSGSPDKERRRPKPD